MLNIIKTEYSMLDCIRRMKRSIDEAVEEGQKYLAIADHNVVFGIYMFQKQCKKAGITPVIGCDLTITNYYGDGFGNIKVFAKNDAGYKNILALSTIANTTDDTVAHITLDDLERYHFGLVCTSGGDESELINCVQNGQSITPIINKYHDMFGDDYYIELSWHNIPAERDLFNSEELRNAVEENGITVIFNNNAHYTKKSDAVIRAMAQEFKTSAIDGKEYLEGYRARDPYTDYNDEFYYRTEDEMYEQYADFLAIYPNAIEDTDEIAKKCAGERVEVQRALPSFPLPDGYNNAEIYLRDLVWKGFHERFPDESYLAKGRTFEDYEKQLEYEYEVICSMGFTNYFLIVQDFIQWCKDTEVYKHPEVYFPQSRYDWDEIPDEILKKDYLIFVGPGRGSAAGSLLAYCLKITDVIDPMKYDLYFERFLNKERVSMPDIDTDYSNRDRMKVVEFAQHKYGFDHVCQIVTFQCLNPKSLFKKMAKALGIAYADADAITKEFPNVYINEDGDEKPVSSLQDLLRFDFIKEKIKKYSWVEEIFHKGAVLDGLPANTGKHAAGVIIGSDPIQNKMALMKVDGILVSQFEKNNSEEIGNLKMDFLGLQTEDLLQDCVEIIKKNTGDVINVNEIPLDDKATYQMLQRGESSNVFQLESSGMKNLLKKMRPTEFEHLSAVLALFRPGPMQFIDEYVDGFHNPDHVHYPHPIYKDVAGNTFGILVYQEQIMALAQKMAGFTLGEADILRRGIGHKEEALIISGRKKFVEGAASLHNVPENVANEIYDTIMKFAKYGFNKAHSVGYAVISYQTAWLKCHYPVEFMTACCNINSSEISDKNNKLAATIAEARRMGIEVLPPEYGKSKYDFTVEDGKIRVGLRGVKAVGKELAFFLASAEKKSSFNDAILAIPSDALVKRGLQNLINAGYFDEFGTRSALTSVMSMICDVNKTESLFVRAGVPSWLSCFNEIKVPDLPEIPMLKRLLNERAVVQCNFGDFHPVRVVRSIMDEEVSERTIASVCAGNDMLGTGDTGTLVLLIECIRKVNTKRGEEMAILSVSDETGEAEVVVFPAKWKDLKNVITANYQKPCKITGKVNFNELDGQLVLSVICDAVEPISTEEQNLFIFEDALDESLEKKLRNSIGTAHVITLNRNSHLIKNTGITTNFALVKKFLVPNTFYYKETGAK